VVANPSLTVSPDNVVPGQDATLSPSGFAGPVTYSVNSTSALISGNLVVASAPGTYTITATYGGESATAYLYVSSAGSTTPALPTIASVSPLQLQPTGTQTITINGQGFGTQYPYSGDSPFLEVKDTTREWDAGHATDLVHLYVISWTDSQIIIGGFTGDYGGGLLDNYQLKPGDQVTISVWNAQTGFGPATYTATVGQMP